MAAFDSTTAGEHTPRTVGRTAILPTVSTHALKHTAPFTGLGHEPARSILPTVAPRHRKAGSYLTAGQVERLMASALKRGRYGDRDQTLILIMFRHGFRLEEALSLTWGDIDWARHELKVHRSKNGNGAVHPLRRTELQALRRLYPGNAHHDDLVFTSERHGGVGKLSSDAAQKMIRLAGMDAGLGHVHPHMLRHSCGHYLANHGHDTRAIQDYLGHRNIQSTVGYTRSAPGRFRDFWKD
jgi:integrase